MLAIIACAERALGPHARPRINVVDGLDTLVLTSPAGEPVGRVTIVVRTPGGIPLRNAPVSWRTTAADAVVQDADPTTDRDGMASATWIFGSRADEEQRLTIELADVEAVELVGLAVAGSPAAVQFSLDTISVALGQATPISPLVRDRFGNVVDDAVPLLLSLDTTRVSITPEGALLGRQRGVGLVEARLDDLVSTLAVQVVQEVVDIRITTDTLRFDALGLRAGFDVQLIDTHEQLVADSLPILELLSGHNVVRMAEPGLLEAIGNGYAVVRLSAGDVERVAHVAVRQRAVRGELRAGSESTVRLRRVGDPLGIVCVGEDASGFSVPASHIMIRGRGGVVAESPCDGVAVLRSGVDTIEFVNVAEGNVLDVAVAIRPEVLSTTGALVVADSFGGSWQHWAPTAIAQMDGAIDLYFALYERPEGDTLTYANLHRLRSPDGSAPFVYQGIALRHDPSPCDPDGHGIENIAIVPRAEAAGYRMYYSSGSHCVGWKVRSAVSVDGVTWTKEDGTRVGNPTGFPAFSAGEGIAVRQREGGGWQMWVGVFVPTEGFAIEEWHSSDQLAWARYRRLYSPLTFPAGPKYAVFSPSLVQIGPSMWRMFLSADTRNEANSTSAIYSAVSRNLTEWVFEGEVLASPAVNFWYATVAGSHLFFIRQLPSEGYWLGHAPIVQP